MRKARNKKKLATTAAALNDYVRTLSAGDRKSVEPRVLLPRITRVQRDRSPLPEKQKGERLRSGRASIHARWITRQRELYYVFV